MKKDVKNLLRDWKKRWKNIEDYEKKELAHLSIEQKYLQLAFLMKLAGTLKLDYRENSDTQRVRRRWKYLRETLT